MNALLTLYVGLGCGANVLLAGGHIEGLEPLGELLLGRLVTEGRDDDHLLAVLPVDGRGHAVVGCELERVYDAQHLRK
jgi:hypothetical protein